MELHHRHKRREEQELLVCVTDNPILLRLLATTQSSWLARVEQHAYGAVLVVEIQELSPLYLDLVCDICVASGQLCATPTQSRAPGCAG